MHINQLALAKSSTKRKTHFIRLRTCHTADIGQVWPENDTHDWTLDNVVMQRTMAKCGKKIMLMPLVGELCLTADFDQMWSKLCPSLEDIVTQRTLTKCGPNCALHWRTFSCRGLWPNVAQIVPLIGGLCHAVDFNQMWPKLCPSLEDIVTQWTLTKCGPKCAPCWRTLSHCELQPNLVRAYAPHQRTLSHLRHWPNLVQTCAPQQMTSFCYRVWPHMDQQRTHDQKRLVQNKRILIVDQPKTKTTVSDYIAKWSIH